ncbi:MAG: RIP metalloprotease RseP [Nitrospirae bacterium]|nr:RIP metalloprotease RseP [Nitrospirota bacterium]
MHEMINTADVMHVIFSIASAIVALGILVFAHEFGHFIVAKMSGVGVLKFSLGFGRKLIGWKRGETEYMVSAIPLGGYVKMIGGEGDEDDKELTPDEKARSFMAQPVWKRMAIVLAGPVFNILLAFVLCYVLLVTGFPTAVARVAGVAPGSPAEKAGFLSGDIIEGMDGNPTDIWFLVADYVKAHPGKVVAFKVRRGGETLDIKAAPVPGPDGKGYIGLAGSAIIDVVFPGSPADKAGIRGKDRVVAVDGKEVGSWDDMAGVIHGSPGRELDISILRDGKPMSFKVTPDLKEDLGNGKSGGVIGITPGSDTEKVRYGVVESAGLAIDRTLLYTKVISAFLARLVSGKEDAKQLGGPIMIVQMSGMQAQQGYIDFVMFMVMLSVNLGVINLFPIPVLDGGHIFFLAIEGIIRRPLSIKMREVAQQIGLFMIIVLMVFVFYHDILRIMGLEQLWK